MTSDKKFNVGDEVYVFQRGLYDWFLTSLRENSFIKGTVINVDHVDYGYHGSGDWIWVYEVKGEDGKIYQGDYRAGYNPYSLFSKEDIINRLNSLISGGKCELEKLRKKVNNDNREYQMLIDKYQNLGETKGKQYKKTK